MTDEDKDESLLLLKPVCAANASAGARGSWWPRQDCSRLSGTASNYAFELLHLSPRGVILEARDKDDLDRT